MLLGSNDDINVVGETVKDLPNQNECKKDVIETVTYDDYFYYLLYLI